jgi:hypothetical protein
VAIVSELVGHEGSQRTPGQFLCAFLWLKQLHWIVKEQSELLATSLRRAYGWQAKDTLGTSLGGYASRDG